MAKRVEPWNPNTADWLVTQRGKRTQDEIVAAMAERGVGLKRAWLSRIENGAHFSADLLDEFVKLYGSVPQPYEPTTAPVSEPTLAAALSDLAVELRESRRARESFEIRLGAAEAELRSLRARPKGGGSPKRSAPLGKAG